MIIDIFRNKELFNKLSVWNNEVDGVTNNLMPGIDIWFNSSQAVLNPLNRCYPDIDPIQYDKKWELHMTIPNFMTLFLIDLFYRPTEDIIIEDACTGTGELIHYLAKLGYKNFHVIDNWCQVPQHYFTIRMSLAKVKPLINDLSVNPTVMNLVGYPFYPRKIGNGVINNVPEGQVFFDWRYAGDYQDAPLRTYIPSSCELFCHYLPDGTDKIREDLKQANMIFLCKDEDTTCYAFARADKYEEFKEKLKEYQCK
jgi:hypothetical protein